MVYIFDLSSKFSKFYDKTDPCSDHKCQILADHRALVYREVTSHVIFAVHVTAYDHRLGDDHSADDDHRPVDRLDDAHGYRDGVYQVFQQKLKHLGGFHFKR